MTTAVAPAGPTATTSTRGSRIWSRVLIGLATVLTILGIVAVWANREILNADNWSNTSTTLLANPTIRDATANYLVNQLYANVDVPAEIGNALPDKLKPLAGPISGALHSGAVSATEDLLATPAAQNAWRAANKLADQAFIQIVNGGTKHVQIRGDTVTLNLGLILQEVANRLGISVDIASHLPPNVAKVELFKAKEISTIQTIGQALKSLALILSILAPLLFAAAVAVAKGRRRHALKWVGIGGVIAGLVVILFRRIIINQVPGAISNDEVTKHLISIVTGLATNDLVEVAGAVILVGVVIVICAWFAGPSRFATPARRWLAPYMRNDPLIVFSVVGVVLILIFVWQPIPATGRPFAMIVFALLAALGTEMLRRQTMSEFPAPVAVGAADAAPATQASSEAPTVSSDVAADAAATEQGPDVAADAPTEQGPDVAAGAPTEQAPAASADPPTEQTPAADPDQPAVDPDQPTEKGTEEAADDCPDAGTVS